MRIQIICSKCGYPAENQSATVFCPSCGEVGTFLPTVDDNNKDDDAA